MGGRGDCWGMLPGLAPPTAALLCGAIVRGFISLVCAEALSGGPALSSPDPPRACGALCRAAFQGAQGRRRRSMAGAWGAGLKFAGCGLRAAV